MEPLGCVLMKNCSWLKVELNKWLVILEFIKRYKYKNSNPSHVLRKIVMEIWTAQKVAGISRISMNKKGSFVRNPATSVCILNLQVISICSKCIICTYVICKAFIIFIAWFAVNSELKAIQSFVWSEHRNLGLVRKRYFTFEWTLLYSQSRAKMWKFEALLAFKKILRIWRMKTTQKW